ncbi:MAG: NAD-dependent epimerase/dehydratase family protein [Candidatus Diapherotrites archaeon]|nr:NAD-dependent epimerase/dehydratase family protein [Candidatus Diapherotrites archaeon]
MNKKILVTGSSGFVGKALVSELKRRGFEVKEFDLNNGMDILNYHDCKKAVKGCYAVVHCAAILDESSKMLFKVNVEGTENIIKAASEEKVERFLFISTAGVHGPQDGKVSEESPVLPQTKYEKSKAMAEEKVEEFQEMIHITIIRPAIVLGPNEYWKKIFKMIKSGFPLIGSGKNKWQIIYIDDLIDAIAFCLENEKTSDEKFIVAEEKALTLEELCLEIRVALGLERKIMKIPVWLGKLIAYLYIIPFGKKIITPAHVDRLIRNREYSIERIKKAGWKPKWDAKKGILALAKSAKMH